MYLALATFGDCTFVHYICGILFEFGAKPNKPHFPRIKPPWEAVSGVFPIEKDVHRNSEPDGPIFRPWGLTASRFTKKPSRHKKDQLAYHRLCHLPPSMYQTKLYVSWWHLLDCSRKRTYTLVIIYFVLAPFETAPRNKYFQISNIDCILISQAVPNGAAAKCKHAKSQFGLRLKRKCHGIAST